jgi:hypothetical protein
VYLQLDPGESRVLRTSTSSLVSGSPWSRVEAVGAPEPLEGPWQLAFVDGGPALPASSQLRALASWTTLVDPEARRFAGTGRHTLRFERPAGAADDWLLDLGRVAETARVRLNGRDLAFHDANVVNVDYKPPDASSWPLRDSGLLGPVTLQRLRVSSPLPKGEPR